MARGNDFGGEIVFSGLSNASILSAENETALADLIYDTDPYIYPAMFGSRENARAILPLLHRSQDRMFRLDNYYTAQYKSRIIGLLLWTKGRMNWSPEPLRAAALRAGVRPSPYLDLVAGEYVERYSDAELADRISIVNLCVSPDFRGRGVGRGLMQRFIGLHPDSVFELCVLAENTAAIELYKSMGFVVTEKYSGFSISRRRPDALVMQRTASL